MLDCFSGFRTSFPYHVSLVGSHASSGTELRQFESGKRSVAAHRATGILPGEHKSLGTRKKEEEEASAEEDRATGEEQHQSALSVSARDQRGRG